MKALPYAALAFLSIGVTAYAVVGNGFLPLGSLVHQDMRLKFEAHRLAIYTHVFASAVALLLGPLQFSSALRSARPFLHRLTGRIYLGFGVVLGGTSGLFMASLAGFQTSCSQNSSS